MENKIQISVHYKIVEWYLMQNMMYAGMIFEEFTRTVDTTTGEIPHNINSIHKFFNDLGMNMKRGDTKKAVEFMVENKVIYNENNRYYMNGVLVKSERKNDDIIDLKVFEARKYIEAEFKYGDVVGVFGKIILGMSDEDYEEE